MRNHGSLSDGTSHERERHTGKKKGEIMIKSKREKIRQYLVIAALTLALVGTAAFPISTEPVSASTAQPATQATPANPEIPIQSVSFPKNVTLKQGESKTLSITVSPSNTTYLTNIAWG